MIKIDMDTLNTWGNECLKSTAFSEKEDTKIVLRATRDTTAARHLFGIQRIGLAMADSINPPFAYSGEAGQRFQAKLDTHSRASWTVVA